MGLFSRSKKATNPARSVKLSVKLRRESGAAVSMDKFAAAPINMRKGAAAAHSRLSQDGLLGVRAGGIFVLDHSGSMSPDYTSGAVQGLAEKTLAFMLQFTPSVTLIAFDSVVHPPIEVTIDNYQGVIAREVSGRYGSTDLASALGYVRDLIVERGELQFVAVLTDGVPNEYDYRTKDAAATTEVVCDLASYPCFLKFVGVREVEYLQFLDDLEEHRPGARLLDNCDTKIYAGGLGSITAERFSGDMTDEWASTIAGQQAAGVLT